MRCRHLLKVTRAIKTLAAQQGITVVEYTQQEMRETLTPQGMRLTTHMLCQALVHHYPRLTSRLPKEKRIDWEAAPHSTPLFMAVAYALTWAKKQMQRK